MIARLFAHVCTGAFTAHYRNRIITSFVEMCACAGIPHTSRFSLSAILGEPVKVGVEAHQTAG